MFIVRFVIFGCFKTVWRTHLTFAFCVCSCVGSAGCSFCEVASVVCCCAWRVLRPHFGLDHQGHFLGASFLNKGIDFIGLLGVFKDRAIRSAVSNHFKNTGSPVICCGCGRPAGDKDLACSGVASD